MGKNRHKNKQKNSSAAKTVNLKKEEQSKEQSKNQGLRIIYSDRLEDKARYEQRESKQEFFHMDKSSPNPNVRFGANYFENGFFEEWKPEKPIEAPAKSEESDDNDFFVSEEEAARYAKQKEQEAHEADMKTKEDSIFVNPNDFEYVYESDPVESDPNAVIHAMPNMVCAYTSLILGIVGIIFTVTYTPFGFWVDVATIFFAIFAKGDSIQRPLIAKIAFVLGCLGIFFSPWLMLGLVFKR